MKKKKVKKESLTLNKKFANKMAWGGRTDRGYIHYETPDGEKISIALSSDRKK